MRGTCSSPRSTSRRRRSAFTTYRFCFQAEDGIRDYKVTGVQTCALPICFHAIHPRHLQIKGHHIGLQLFNFFQCESAIHGGADNFDGRIAREDRGDQFPHESGVIDDENADTFAHAIAPSGVPREVRDRTAGTLRMRTTVPSPRKEAPLTRSLETISAGSALITSSSSPTKLSTRRPKRFSAAPMTMTKCFFRTGWVSILRKRLRWSSRTSVRIWSRRR